jgi:hypothetical protein
MLAAPTLLGRPITIVSAEVSGKGNRKKYKIATRLKDNRTSITTVLD